MRLHVAGGADSFAYPYRWAHQKSVAGDVYMDLTLQFGYGMMQHTQALLADWGGGTVVLSPRDLDDTQVRRLSAQITKLGAEVLIDPQCYLHGSDHFRLVKHAYFQVFSANTTGALLGGAATADLLRALSELNTAVGAGRLIVPGRIAKPVDDDWFALQEVVLDEAPFHFSGPRLATIALSSEAVLDEAQIEAIVDRSEAWKADGYYVVAETPNGSYLVDDPRWVANLLSLLAGLHLQRRYVVLGYANHQMLAAAATNIDAIAAGTWLNVRRFDPDRFMSPEEGDIARRTTWYYAPQALSEFKIPFLDIAERTGVLAGLAPPGGYPRQHADPLFSGGQPSSVGWTEQQAFRHYLTTLRHQVKEVSLGGFDATYDGLMRRLDGANDLLRQFRRLGVFAGDRDFAAVVDATRSGLVQLQRTRGGRLRREW